MTAYDDPYTRLDRLRGLLADAPLPGQSLWQAAWFATAYALLLIGAGYVLAVVVERLVG
jgi:hypothetical protein